MQDWLYCSKFKTTFISIDVRFNVYYAVLTNIGSKPHVELDEIVKGTLESFHIVVVSSSLTAVNFFFTQIQAMLLHNNKCSVCNRVRDLFGIEFVLIKCGVFEINMVF